MPAFILLLLLAPLSAATEFSPYDQVIPGTGHAMAMVPVAGGAFTMGSPESEAGRSAAEGPQRTVAVSDFWMGQFEVNWQQYEVFVHRDQASFNALVDAERLAALAIDGVTGATTPYVEMSFGMGKDGYPAVNMTQYAALRYARWLSAVTGHFYRLPTEAEWEYACRAGTTTAWSFGESENELGAYAVYRANSDERYALPGSRRANPWQIYDLHGNVAEWTMDQFAADFYASAPADNPWNRPEVLYPRVARGGSWLDDAAGTRCAARLASAPQWKARDPQIPRSDWWLTNAPFVGFRLVRPRVEPLPEDIARYWLQAIEDYGM